MIQALKRLYRMVLLVVGRGRIKAAPDDTGNVQLLQIVLSDFETRDKTPRLAEYGFSSNPPDDSDAVAIFVGGDRANGVIIATGHQASRFKNLERGEVAIYNNAGASAVLKKNGDIEFTSPTIFKFAAPNAHFTGDVLVDGTLTATTDVVGGGKSLKTHTHSDPQGGNTGPPT